MVSPHGVWRGELLSLPRCDGAARVPGAPPGVPSRTRGQRVKCWETTSEAEKDWEASRACFPRLREPHRTVRSVCAHGRRQGGRRPTALFSELQELVAQCFSSFLFVSPFFGPWYEQERCSAVTGCVDCPQMATVGSGQGVQNSMRGKIHIERHFSQLSRLPAHVSRTRRDPAQAARDSPSAPGWSKSRTAAFMLPPVDPTFLVPVSLLPPRSSHSQGSSYILTEPARLCPARRRCQLPTRD